MTMEVIANIGLAIVVIVGFGCIVADIILSLTERRNSNERHKIIREGIEALKRAENK